MTQPVARRAAALAICIALGGGAGAAQSPSGQVSGPLRIDAAVALALANYPAIRAAAAQVDAAHAGADLARTSYLPRTDLLWQENRATRNSVAGLLLPQSVIPSISGPVAAATSDAIWGSAVGALFSWEPFDFGLRRANVTAAERLVTQATAGMDLTRFEVATHAADAFLSALAADEVVRAAQANVDRLQVVASSVSTLVQNQLRPGADGSRAEAELAAARIQVLKAQLAATSARATLAEAIGLAGQAVTPDAGSLFRTIPSDIAAPRALEAHPLARAEQAAVAAIHSRVDAIGLAYVPRVSLQSALFGRGAVPPGLTGSGTTGLWPTTANWAAGVSVTFSVFDGPGIGARRRLEAGNEAALRARYNQTLQALRAQDVRATAALDAARQILAAVPAELRAAHDADAQARARYQAGLAPLTDVVDAARLLTQAEVDDVLSRLAVWETLLAEASARGDLTLFLDRVK